ncbi:sigma-70 family RNA polymerase sigma factor [Micromonosporaceae bacterium Da 78-11]
MQVSQMPAQVVRDARAGDRRALDVLVSAYLPLVYNVVRRSAENDLDVDDIVQETMLRMIGGIAGVREEDRLRSWVVTIALRQLTEARQRAGQERARREAEMPDRVDPSIDVERSVALRLVLTDEQQELERAATWLDDTYREVLTFWWLEARGDLTRSEAAAAFGEPVAHFAVRLQRMRKQLDTARAVVQVLDTEPPCPDLAVVLGAWDGTPTPLWRKRIAAHLRDCVTCGGRSLRLPNPEWMLAALPMVVPPPPLVTKIAGLVHTGLAHAGTATSTAGLAGVGNAAPAAVAGKSALFGIGSAKIVATAAAVVLVGGGLAAVAIARPDSAKRPQVAVALPSATQRASANPVPSAVLPSPSVSVSKKPVPTSNFRTVVPAIPVVKSVREVGAIRQGPRVGGRDNGQSAAYGGKSIWIFDDTTLKDPWGFLSNSAALTTDLDASDGIDLRSGNGFTVRNTQTPVELIARSSAEKAFEKANSGSGCSGAYCGAIFGFWPGPVIADPARHRVLVTYGKLCRGGKDGTPCSGPLGKGLGMGIAELDLSSGRVTRLTPAHGSPVTSVEGRDRSIFFGPGATGFGSAAALVVNDQAYLYGGCSYQGCRLARVPLASLSDLSTWRYYASSKWVTDPAKATRIGIEPGAAGQTVFYSPAMKAYVNVFMPFGSNDVRFQVGGSPFGPWSKSRKLLTTAGGSSSNYALFGHPEYAEKNGLVQYLSYFKPGTGEQRLIRWESAP